MIVEPQMSIHQRIAGRRLRVGLYHDRTNQVVAKRVFAPGSDVTIGNGPDDGLTVPVWTNAPLRLISDGHFLHFGAGMRLHMCHDEGEHRVVGELQELIALGLTSPIRITVSKVNIRIQDGFTVFVKYLTKDEPDWPDSGAWSVT